MAAPKKPDRLALVASCPRLERTRRPPGKVFFPPGRPRRRESVTPPAALAPHFGSRPRWRSIDRLSAADVRRKERAPERVGDGATLLRSALFATVGGLK